MKTCVRCSMEFNEGDVLDVSSATELVDYLSFHPPRPLPSREGKIAASPAFGGLLAMTKAVR
ncbi:MAG: hypothetical protein IMF10_05245 [Proteobacteria bacterium]|nr:hypothetical protein [Pseudomonadota bacterium]